MPGFAGFLCLQNENGDSAGQELLGIDLSRRQRGGEGTYVFCHRLGGGNAVVRPTARMFKR